MTKPVHFIFENDVKIKGCKKELFSVHCYNGFATAISNTDNRELKLRYPKLEELSDEQKTQIIKHRGLLKNEKITFSDVMALFGNIEKSNSSY